MSSRPICHADRPRWRLAGAVLAVLVAILPLAARPGQSPRPGLPAVFDSYLNEYVHLGAQERAVLTSGGPVTKLLDVPDESKEVAVFGAAWITSTQGAYVELVKDIERFESGGGFAVTRLISDPPRLDDFAALELSDEDIADLRRCRVGACDVKLGADALERLQREVDWNKPSAKADVTAIVRRLAFEYVGGYREGGNAELAVYRDKERPTFVANEFRSMIDRLPPLSTYLPDVKRFLLGYPRERLEDSTDFLYWQQATFGLKPIIRINHLAIQQRPGQTVVASKMLYASHYFWTALELRVLMSDPAHGPGFWFITVSRSRSDGLSGFVGRLIRGRVRSEVQSGMLAALSATKATLERKRGPGASLGMCEAAAPAPVYSRAACAPRFSLLTMRN